MDAGDGKVARNGGYLGSGRSMASGGRFYGSLSWYRAAGCSVLSGGALGLAVVAASRTRMCSRNVAMTSGFSMQAMTRSVPPHLGQVSMSMPKTRFRRCIQVMGQGAYPAFHGEVCVLARRTHDACDSARTRRGTGSGSIADAGPTPQSGR